METDQERVEHALALLEEVQGLVTQCDEEVDPAISDILNSLDDATTDLELLEFDDDGGLVEPDDVIDDDSDLDGWDKDDEDGDDEEEDDWE